MAVLEPILIDVPSHIETERLRLRVPRVGDGAVILPTVWTSLEELKPWMPWATDEYDEKGAEIWCRHKAAEFIARRDLQYLIFDAAGRHLGNLGAFRFDWSVPSCEIGYWLGTEFTGNGLMTEAVRGLHEMVASTIGAVRIEILTDEKNAKSRRVAERCGYGLEATRRNHGRAADGSLRNQCVYAWIAG